jgi:hypothetical protein
MVSLVSASTATKSAHKAITLQYSLPGLVPTLGLALAPCGACKRLRSVFSTPPTPYSHPQAPFLQTDHLGPWHVAPRMYGVPGLRADCRTTSRRGVSASPFAGE